MKPTLDTPDKLVLSQRPIAELAIAGLATIAFTAVAALLFAAGNDAGVIFAVFAISGPVYLYFFLEAGQVVFDRGGGVVTLFRRGPRGTTAQEFALAGLQRAAVQRPGRAPVDGPVDPGPRPTGFFRAVLIYEDGHKFALSDGFSRGDTAFGEARAINAWLAAA